MAFKDTQTLTCLLFIWLNVIEVSTFVTFNEQRIKLLGSFYENAMESFDGGDGKGKSGAQIGRLVIGQNNEGLSSEVSSHKNAYQSEDAGRVNLEPLWGQVYGLNTLYTPAVEQLLGMKPKVDCVGDLMKLTIHGRDASFGSNFLIDRGSISPLPLSQLPSECGHTLQRTWRDFVFVIPHDGCYVSQEKNAYILPLLWWGLPLRMSCSSSTLAQRSPHVSCYTNGMIVKLQSDATVNLKIKVMNEWHPLMKASAKCGYSLVSHPEGMAIHAPYMPCTKAKDGMFTLSLATEREFNLSCPALLLSLPISESEQPCKSDAFIPSSTVSSTLAIASVETTKPTESQTTTISSTTQKLSPIPLPYHIPDHPYFKPITPNYPFQLFHPNVPPIVAPFDSRAVVTPSPITQRPQTPIDPKPLDPKPPQVWYPWYPKPNLIPAPEPAKSIPVLPPREPVLPPTEAPKPSSSPLVYLLTPTSIPLQDKTTTPRKPPVQWAPVYPPRKLVYPFYLRNPGFVNTSSAAVDQLRPGKPGFVDTTSVALGQGPHWLYPSQTRPRPDEPPQIKPFEQHALPIPAPTKKVESPQLLHFPWYKPYQEKHLEMPSVPIKVPQIPQSEAPQSFSISSIQGPPLNLHFTSSTYPTSAPSKTTEVAYTSAPTKPPLTQSNLSHALFHCPTCCPGPPSISYHCHNHHHNHHYFAHPHLAAPILTKLTAEIQSFPSSSSALFQGVGYNSSPYSSKVEALAPAAQYVAPIEYPFIKPILAPDSEPLMRPTLCPYTFRTVASNLVSSQSASKPTNIPLFVRPWEPTKPPSRSSQNASVVESVAHSVQSPTPALYQAKMQHYISQWRQHMPPFVAPNNAERVLQSHHEVSLKPTTPPTDDKSLSNNYWYQAASYPRPPMSNAPAEFFKQASVNNDHTSLQSAAPSQPKQTHNMDVPIQLNVHPSMYIHNSVPGNTQLYDHQNGEPSVPIFRDPEPFGSYWVPAVQSNQKTVQSTHYQDGSIRDPLQFVSRQMG